MENNVNFNNDYYYILGINQNADQNTINNAYIARCKEFNKRINVAKNDNEIAKLLNSFNFINEAYKVLTNKELKLKYDNFRKKQLNNTNSQRQEESRKNRRPVRVEKSENNIELANKGRNHIKSTNTNNIIAACLISGGIVLTSVSIGALGAAGILTYKSLKNTNEKEIETIVDTDDYNITGETAMVIDDLNNENNSNDVKSEEVVSNEIENTQEEIQQIENQTIDVNSYTEIDNTTNKVFAELATINGSGRKLSLDLSKNEVEEMVIYVRHNCPNFGLEYRFGNTAAYDNLFALAQDGVDISMFYEGLDTYDNIHQLYEACSKITQESNDYSDEINAYKAMENAVNEMHCKVNNKRNDFPEIIAISCLVESYIDLRTMEMARGGALENAYINPAIINGANIILDDEGQDYNNEKMYTKDIADECARIHSEVTFENPNGILANAVNNAVREDERRSNSK